MDYAVKHNIFSDNGLLCYNSTTCLTTIRLKPDPEKLYLKLNKYVYKFSQSEKIK